MTVSPDEAPASPLMRRLHTGWRLLKSVLVFVFVTWNLFFLTWRNPVDLWWNDDTETWAKSHPWWPEFDRRVFTPVNEVTETFGHLTGMEQGWSMFSAPLARSAPFLAAKLEFDDGSEDMAFSENEFTHDGSYLRVGGWRQRKLEDTLVAVKPWKLPKHSERSLWQAFVRFKVRAWQTAHPNDPRRIKTVTLLRRRIYFPAQDQDQRTFEEFIVLLAEYTPDGTLLAYYDEGERTPVTPRQEPEP